MDFSHLEDARAFYQRKGIGQRVGYGKKAAIIVVDLQKAFTDPRCPLGANILDVLNNTRKLLDVARARNIHIYYTITSYRKDMADAGIWAKKNNAIQYTMEDTEWVELDESLGRLESEPIIIKKFPSAFFGTVLQSMLVVNRIDTVVIAGAVTSGCIRATVVDGLSLGYHVIVPRECVADRHEFPHEANLFDIDAKYGDVVSLVDVLKYLTS